MPQSIQRRRSGRWSRRGVIKTGLAASIGLALSRCSFRRRPNVVLVSIDTLRADRVHCYGNPRATTPCVDQLASEGVRFRNAFSTAPWTLPAHLSLFTSQEAGKFFQSVAVYGHSGDKSAYPILYRHQKATPTIASALTEAGYESFGVHGALLTDSVWGLDYGFREYDFSPRDDQFLLASRYLRDREETSPFFAFVHTYVVHRPFLYESVFGDRASRPAGLRGVDFAADRLDGHEITPVDPEAPLYAWQPEPEEIEYVKTVYDGGVRAADQHLEGLIRTLKETGVYDDTMIVVTADHGEEFWEHIPECSPDHNHSLFDELLRVPLIIKFPGGEFAGKEIDSLARIIDIGPTILDAVGAPQSSTAVGDSLLPDIQGQPTPRDLYAACTYMGPTRFAIRDSRFKYIRCAAPRSFRPHFEAPPEALYDLTDDPGETRNLVDRRPEVVADMRARLASRRQADLPISLALDDPLTLRYIPAMGLEERAAALLAEGKRTARLPQLGEASDEIQKSLRSLGYL